MKILPQKSLVIMISLIFFTAAQVFSFETGHASWYGGKFQGRKTANGEIFDTNKLTAAHKTLPFNTLVKVTNLQNRKTVTVRINDRGPFVEGRVIDLSHAAAEVLDMTVAGVAPVQLEIISLPEGYSEDNILKTSAVHPEGVPESYKIQIASYSQPDNAAVCLSKILKAGLQAEFESAPSGMIRVVIPGVKEEELEDIKALLGSLGFHTPLIRHN